ncbi:hypothetical protein [Streptomyces sp. NPDC058694]|uniref:hypothetical protein n=1 Tax=Streptomyces sp. NPDC058694 TaxID=3346603 RepID=UPI00364AB6B1
MFAKAQPLAVAAAAALLIFLVSSCGESGEGADDPLPLPDIVYCSSTTDCQEPNIEAPEEDEREGEVPVDEAPIDEVPVDEGPGTEVPAGEDPIGEDPVGEEPGGGYTEVPDPPDVPEADVWTDPPANGCAYWGEIGCPDTPILIPPPDLSPWS